MVYVIGLELMKDWNNYGTICEGCQACGSPVGTVLAAKCYAVTGLKSGLLKQDVEFGDTACYIAEKQCRTFVVSECLKIPVLDNGTAYISVQILLCEDIVGSVVKTSAKLSASEL